MPNRKIELPRGYNPMTGTWFIKPRISECDHDFDPDFEEASSSSGECGHWTCTKKCGGIRCYEVNQ